MFLWLGSFLLSIVINCNFKNHKENILTLYHSPSCLLDVSTVVFQNLEHLSFLFHSFCICTPLVLKYPQLLLFLILQLSASVSSPQRNHSWPQFSPAFLLLLLLFFCFLHRTKQNLELFHKSACLLICLLPCFIAVYPSRTSASKKRHYLTQWLVSGISFSTWHLVEAW